MRRVKSLPKPHTPPPHLPSWLTRAVYRKAEEGHPGDNLCCWCGEEGGDTREPDRPRLPRDPWRLLERARGSSICPEPQKTGRCAAGVARVHHPHAGVGPTRAQAINLPAQCSTQENLRPSLARGREYRQSGQFSGSGPIPTPKGTCGEGLEEEEERVAAHKEGWKSGSNSLRRKQTSSIELVPGHTLLFPRRTKSKEGREMGPPGP